MNISVPDELAEQVRAMKIPISETCQRALREAVETARLRDMSDMQEITVEVGDPAHTVAFTGRWLIEPDRDETRTSEEGYDAGAYYGVALTKRGRLAIYVAHVNEGWPANLIDYDSIDDAEQHVPADILARTSGELAQERVVWRDI